MTVLTDAFVLRKSPRGDFDRQYVFYTKELGKITALAKGAMKISSKLAPHLDYFYLSEIMVASGRGFYRLAGAKIKKNFGINGEDRLKISSACFLLEAANNLIIDDNPDERIFAILENFFICLSGAKNNQELQLVFNRSLF